MFSWIAGSAILFFPSILLGQDPFIRTKYRDFSCGYIDSYPAHYLQPGCSPNAANWLIDESLGALAKRKGATEVWRLPSGNIPTGICRLLLDNGNEYLYIGDGANVYQLSDFSTYTLITSNLNTASSIRCRTVNGRLWITNGSDYWFEVNGTSITSTFDGTGDLPKIPRGKYPMYEKNRVYSAATSGATTSVFYSLTLSTTTSDPVLPSSSTAWIGTSEVYCGRGDGEQIFGATELNGVPYIFKENSIWRIVDVDDYSVGCQRVINGVGTVAGDSIAVIEGVAKFLGSDGIYAFDGQSVMPIGEGIRNFHASINQPRVNTDGALWPPFGTSGESTARISTGNVVGKLTLPLDTIDNFSDGDYTSNPVWTVTLTGDGSGSVENERLKLYDVSDSGGYFTISTPMTQSSGTWTYTIECSDNGNSLHVWFMQSAADNTGNGYTVRTHRVGASYYLDILRGSGGGLYPICSSSPLSAYSEVKIARNSSGLIKVWADGNMVCSATDNTYTSSSYFVVSSPMNGYGGYSMYFDNLKIRRPSGYWESGVVDAGSGITGWLTLERKESAQGATATYGKKVNASSTTMVSLAHTTIVPGTQISTTTNRYAQFAATITVTDSTLDTEAYGPEISSISGYWLEGGSNQTLPVGYSWGRRYLLSISTGASVVKGPMLYQAKSPQTGWMPFTGIAINGFQKFGGSLYGISASTNALYRLFGENNTDAGAAVDASWETRDDTADMLDKRLLLQESFVDFSGTDGTEFSVGFSTDSGNTYTDKTVTVSNNLPREVKRLFWSGTPEANQIRFRIRDNTSGDPSKIYGLDTYSKPSEMTIR